MLGSCVGRQKVQDASLSMQSDAIPRHTNRGGGMGERPTMWKEVVHTYIHTKTAERAAQVWGFTNQ